MTMLEIRLPYAVLRCKCMVEENTLNISLHRVHRIDCKTWVQEALLLIAFNTLLPY